MRVSLASPLNSLISVEGINNNNARFFEIPRISCGYSQIMYERRCGNHTVFNGHGLTRLAKDGEQFCPTQTDRGVPWEAIHSLNAIFKPMFKPLSPISGGQKINAKSDFTQN